MENLNRYKIAGMTLLELLIVLSISTYLLTSGVSAYSQSLYRSQIVALTNELVEVLKGAQQWAIVSNQSHYVDTHSDGTSHCWSVSIQSGCHCNSNVVKTCALLFSVDDPQYKQIAVNANREQIVFSPQFGYSNAGSYRLSISGYVIRIVISSLGRIRICTDTGDVNAYAAC